jgi:4-diphosphocytidyl-2-C-methyl-D-erythritol kinase
MGGGLGGGSSNAAADQIALPELARRKISVDQIAVELGSDVPFFLTGGTAIGIGRGTEFYPLPDIAEEPILVIAPGIHTATGPAYAALDRSLTFTGSSSSINSFQSYVRALIEERSAGAASALGANDFEAAVSSQYPQLKTIMGKLRKLDAAGVRMTGSGSAVFAIFRSRTERERARTALKGDRVFQGFRLLAASLVSRAGYRRLWRRQLAEHIEVQEDTWPLRSRHEK